MMKINMVFVSKRGLSKDPGAAAEFKDSGDFVPESNDNGIDFRVYVLKRNYVRCIFCKQFH